MGKLSRIRTGGFTTAAFLFLVIIFSPGCDRKKEQRRYVVMAGDKGLTEEQLIGLIPYEFAPMVDEAQWIMLANGWLSEILLSDFARNIKLDKDTAVARRINHAVNIILVEALRENIRKQVQVADTEIENFYRTNHEEFILNEPLIRAFHIVVSEKEIIDSIRKNIATIKDFVDYARNHSEDFSQSDSCDMGWFSQSQIIPVLGNPLFRSDTAHLIGPIEEGGKHHMFWIVERLPNNTICPFELVREQIREKLLEEKTNSSFTKLLDSLIIVSKSFIDTSAIKNIADSLKRIDDAKARRR